MNIFKKLFSKKKGDKKKYSMSLEMLLDDGKMMIETTEKQEKHEEKFVG